MPFIREVNTNDGISREQSEIEDGLQKRISIQGSRDTMHFEVALMGDIPVGIAMFAMDLRTVYGMPEKGYGTVMGFVDSGMVDPDDHKPIYIKQKRYRNLIRMCLLRFTVRSKRYLSLFDLTRTMPPADYIANVRRKPARCSVHIFANSPKILLTNLRFRCKI